jgi:exoribonuclease II
MYVLFEEAGKYQAGRLLSEAESSAQIELASGKRVKVKATHQVMRFEKPEPDALLAQARALAGEMDLNLAWEFAPEQEFGFADLARDYFSDKATQVEQAASLLALFDAPHYFRRAGKGRFKKASLEIVQQALAAIEKKKLIAAQIEQWVQELAGGQCPQPILDQLYKILFKPDKNAPEYKAVVEAAKSTHMAPLALLQKAGAIRSGYEFHYKRFLFEAFPKGTGFPALQAPPMPGDLPLAAVQAFSIDDSSTTEIDDALSVQGLGTDEVVLGIHIAAPGLVIRPDSAIDAVARHRLSTVYMPGNKITMLPDDLVQTYTLAEGKPVPALSLYVTLDAATLDVKSSRSAIEAVPIAANLRHDVLDGTLTQEAFDANLADVHLSGIGSLDSAALCAQLQFLYSLAKKLKAAREVVRGKPENFNRPDYNFKLLDAKGAEPDGSETVQISVRKRGSPLDLIVAEAMILANSTWGQWLADLGVPAIYRSQASLAPGVKVRMGTKAQRHAGIGVACYAWSTSPLRRYTDLVNQWQIIACVQSGATAALVAPFKPKDAQLFAIISGFDAAYSSYNGFQASMERLWTLKALQQNGITELEASLFKDGMVRADAWPLVLPVMGADGLPRGARVRVKLGQIDEIALDVSGTVIERLDAEVFSDEPQEDEDDEVAAGPLTIAVDVNEAPAGESGETSMAA